MLLEEIEIKNFRNFENIKIQLKDRNVLFGMNDIGKTNFLYAIRFVLDYQIRKNNFKETDFFNRNTSKKIEITLKLNLEEENNNNEDIQKIIAAVAGDGAMSSGEKFLYIKIQSINNQTPYFDIEQLCGSDLNYLEPVQKRGLMTKLDNIFNINYIYPQTNLDDLFNKNINNLINKKDDNLDEVKDLTDDLQEALKKINGISNFRNSFNNEFKKYSNEEYEIELSSKDITIDPYKNILPFIKAVESNNIFEISGDGQRKLASYSLLKLKSEKDKTRKINIFLVEEPENHLHKTTLLKLSQLLFNENEYQYLFITTHSDVLLTEMDNVNLIRIFKSKSNDLNLLETKSVLYEVKDEFRKYKRQLNIFLSQALFYNRVMLVEGPSEFTLFDAILTHKINYATKGLFILPVNGIGFEKYLEVLLPLNIKVFVKTDNDIISGRPAGINRILKLGKLVAYINKEECLLKELEKVNIDGNEFENTNEARKQVYNEARKQVYKDNIEIIKSIQNLANIYLSNIDLENDISAALSNLYEILEKENNEKAVKFLQKLKLYNMIELISKMKDEDFEEIFKSEYFKILEDFINGIN